VKFIFVFEERGTETRNVHPYIRQNPPTFLVMSTGYEKVQDISTILILLIGTGD